MHTGGSAWADIKRAAVASRFLFIALSTMAAVILPIAESALVNRWTSLSGEAATAASASSVMVALACIAVSHLALVVGLIWLGRVSGPAAAVEAMDLGERLQRVEAELRRRDEAYRMVRLCFVRMNEGTCALSGDGPEQLCAADFADRLKLVLGPVLENVSTVLGVSGVKFTLEVYLHNWQLPMGGGPKGRHGYALEFFHSPQIAPGAPLELGECAIAPQAFYSGVPTCKRVGGDKDVFYADGKRKPKVYFERYASVPIAQACSPDSVGILVLTSEQHESFAGDVCETLAFIASLISRYLFSYRECIHAKFGFFDRAEVLLSRVLAQCTESVVVESSDAQLRVQEDGTQPFVAESTDGTRREISRELLVQHIRSLEGEATMELVLARAAIKGDTNAAKFMQCLLHPDRMGLSALPADSPLAASP